MGLTGVDQHCSTQSKHAEQTLLPMGTTDSFFSASNIHRIIKGDLIPTCSCLWNLRNIHNNLLAQSVTASAIVC